MAITNINNLITFESTIMACNLIWYSPNLTKWQKAQVLHDIKSTGANANGYDGNLGQTPFILWSESQYSIRAKFFWGATNKSANKRCELLIKREKTSQRLLPLSLVVLNFVHVLQWSKTLAAIHHFVSLFNSKNRDCVKLWNGQSILQNRIYLLLVKEECWFVAQLATNRFSALWYPFLTINFRDIVMKKGLTDLFCTGSKRIYERTWRWYNPGGYNGMLDKQKKVGDAVITTVLFDDREWTAHDRIPLKRCSKHFRIEYFRQRVNGIAWCNRQNHSQNW